MRLVRGLWRLLVGIKDALALVLLLLFFGGLFVAFRRGESADRLRRGVAPRP